MRRREDEQADEHRRRSNVLGQLAAVRIRLPAARSWPVQSTLLPIAAVR